MMRTHPFHHGAPVDDLAPVRAAKQHHGHGVRVLNLAALQQREDFEQLVRSAKAARARHERTAWGAKEQLAARSAVGGAGGQAGTLALGTYAAIGLGCYSRLILDRPSQRCSSGVVSWMLQPSPLGLIVHIVVHWELDFAAQAAPTGRQRRLRDTHVPREKVVALREGKGARIERPGFHCPPSRTRAQASPQRSHTLTHAELSPIQMGIS